MSVAEFIENAITKEPLAFFINELTSVFMVYVLILQS